MPTAPSKASSGTTVIAAESDVPLALAAAALVEANVAETPGCTSVAALPVPEAAEAAEAALVVAEVATAAVVGVVTEVATAAVVGVVTEVATAAVVGVVATVPIRTVVPGTDVESTVALVKVVERVVELSDVTDVDNNVDVLNGVLLSTEFTADVNAAACVCRLVNSALKLVASAPVAVSASLEIDAMLASAADC
ncbi:hypothetical protein LTR10_004007 [Elasticomyces elasticus]|nr:hypothetical protein LTR10_004007 [Elasticomyces elasticus]KAK4977805.1 hypothetical protein LTR42_002180 [Elasticomyces elasticus]